MLILFFLSIISRAEELPKSEVLDLLKHVNFQYWVDPKYKCNLDDLDYAKHSGKIKKLYGPLGFTPGTQVIAACYGNKIHFYSKGAFAWKGKEYSPNCSAIISKTASPEKFNVIFNQADDKKSWVEAGVTEAHRFTEGLRYIAGLGPFAVEALEPAICRGPLPVEIPLLLKEAPKSSSSQTEKKYKFASDSRFVISCNRKTFTITPDKNFTFGFFEFLGGSKLTGIPLDAEVIPRRNIVKVGTKWVSGVGVINNDVFSNFQLIHDKPENSPPIHRELNPSKVENSFRNQTLKVSYTKPDGRQTTEWAFKKEVYKYVSPFSTEYGSFKFPKYSEVWVDPLNPGNAQLAILSETVEYLGNIIPAKSTLYFGEDDRIYYFPAETQTIKGQQVVKDKVYFVGMGLKDGEHRLRFTPAGNHVRELSSIDSNDEFEVHAFENVKSLSGRPVVRDRNNRFVDLPRVINVYGVNGQSLAFLDELSMFCPEGTPLKSCSPGASFRLLNEKIGDIVGFNPFGHLYETEEKVIFKKMSPPTTTWNGKLKCSPANEHQKIEWSLNFKKSELKVNFVCYNKGEEPDVEEIEKIQSFENFKELSKIVTNKRNYYFYEGQYILHTDLKEEAPIYHRFLYKDTPSFLIMDETKAFIYRKTDYYDPWNLGC